MSNARTKGSIFLFPSVTLRRVARREGSPEPQCPQVPAPVPVTCSPRTVCTCSMSAGPSPGILPLRSEGPAPRGGNRPREHSARHGPQSQLEAGVPTGAPQERIIFWDTASLHPMRARQPFPRHCHRVRNLTRSLLRGQADRPLPSALSPDHPTPCVVCSRRCCGAALAPGRLSLHPKAEPWNNNNNVTLEFVGPIVPSADINANHTFILEPDHK